jgi:hypothetical protein
VLLAHFFRSRTLESLSGNQCGSPEGDLVRLVRLVRTFLHVAKLVKFDNKRERHFGKYKKWDKFLANPWESILLGVRFGFQKAVALPKSSPILPATNG